MSEDIVLNDLQISLNSVFLFWFQVDHIIERLNLEQKELISVEIFMHSFMGPEM